MPPRIKSFRLSPAILFALILLPAAGVAAPAEGLLDIYRLADQHDTQLQQAQAAYQASLEARPQSRAGLLPSVGLSANTTWNEQDRTFPGNAAFSGNEDFNSHGYALNLTQPIYRHDAWVRYRQSQDTVSEAEATLMTAQQAMIVRAADRYFNVLAAADNLQFATAEKDAIKRQLEQTQQRFDVGLIAITDVLEAQASYDTAVAQEIEAINLLATAREILRELTGRNHDGIAPLRAETPLVNPVPADIDAWTGKAQESSLALRAAEFAYDAARKEVAAQRAGHYPTLDMVASRSNSVSGGGSLGGSDIDDTRIGLQLNLPLFQGGLTASQTRQARFGAEQAAQSLEEQRRAAIRQTREAYLGVIAAISRVTAFKQARASSQSALEATEAGYDVGTRTTVDVLLARRTVFRAERDYARSRYDYILNSLRLKQAVGTLSPADLEAVNAWLAN